MRGYDRTKCGLPSARSRAQSEIRNGACMRSELSSKYGAGALEIGRNLQSNSFDHRVEQRDDLDQHFTKLWLDFAITGISQRPALDARTRLLVLTGQYTMAKSHRHLEETIRAAL